MPTEQEVTSFLDECCEVARSTVETRLAATRSAAASSLGIDEYGLDKKMPQTREPGLENPSTSERE